MSTANFICDVTSMSNCRINSNVSLKSHTSEDISFISCRETTNYTMGKIFINHSIDKTTASKILVVKLMINCMILGGSIDKKHHLFENSNEKSEKSQIMKMGLNFEGLH